MRVFFDKISTESIEIVKEYLDKLEGVIELEEERNGLIAVEKLREVKLVEKM